MTEQHRGELGEHTYRCPKCGCEFKRVEGEPEACRCPECGKDVDTTKQGCECCRPAA